MTYSYTQISQYLACPRRYKHRYLDGWKEKDTRASMLFGRAFENALAAYFRREDSAAELFREWSAHQQGTLLIPMGYLGPHAAARGSAVGSLCPRGSNPHSPAATQSPDKVHEVRISG